MKDNALRNIAGKWGMAGKVLSSYLAVSSVTATQVDSEDDMSIAFISHTRSYFKHALDKIFETVLNYYGKPNDVSVGFASPSLVNKDRILQRVTAQLEAGLTTIEDAVRELNPDLDEEDLQAKIDTAKKMREEMMLQSQTEFNQEGSFNE
jgi:predicted secreted Zn-dependent protease